jgi:hypothetical protein
MVLLLLLLLLSLLPLVLVLLVVLVRPGWHLQLRFMALWACIMGTLELKLCALTKVY